MRALGLLGFLAIAAGCHADWNGKRAAANCPDAIAGSMPWPSPPCDAMNMCANEARLSSAEHAKLLAQMSRAGCPAP